jgi:AraC-like DNA-binding protein
MIISGYLMAYTKISKINSRPELAKYGFGMDYYPGYVNRQKRLHSVDVVLLSFIIKGNGTHYLGNNAYPEKAPSLSITHYGQVHDIVTDKNGIDVMNIYLNLEKYTLPEMAVELRSILPQVLPLHPNFYETPGHMTRILFEPDSPIKPLGFLMYNEFKSGKPESFFLLKQYFGLFLAECCRQVLKQGLVIHGARRKGSYAVMEPIRQYLDIHYTETVSINDIAKRAGYGPTYLCRIFKEYTGKTVYGYILDKRIQTAMTQLRYTDLQISRIAMDCGFSDFSFFNKFFKKKLKMTPRAYRYQR